MDVEWPGRRNDVLAALTVLAADVPEPTGAGNDPRWPGLTEGVHWLVDDTWWDLQDPVEAIGTILRDDREADAIREVVAAVVVVADRQGATAPDAVWFADEGWPEVRRLAANALALLTG